MSSRLRGTKPLEIMLVVTLVLVFILLASQRILELRQIAERVGVEHTIGSLRGALGIQMTVLVMQQGMDGLAGLHLSNPIDLLEYAPTNYLGESGITAAQQPPGSWYFDLQQRELIYRLRFPEKLLNQAADEPGHIRLQLRVYYDENGAEDTAVRTIRQVAIEPLHEYTWLKEE